MVYNGLWTGMFYLCSNNVFTPVTGGQVASVLDCYAGGLPLLSTSAETHSRPSLSTCAYSKEASLKVKDIPRSFNVKVTSRLS